MLFSPGHCAYADLGVRAEEGIAVMLSSCIQLAYSLVGVDYPTHGKL